MFDGNHRSRRQVNLGGGGRRSRRTTTTNSRIIKGTSAVPSSLSLSSATTATTSSTTITTLGGGGGGGDGRGRASTLEQAKRMREERAFRQLQQTSARHVQRIWRGYAARKQVCQNLLEIVLQPQPQQQSRRVMIPLEASVLLSFLLPDSEDDNNDRTTTTARRRHTWISRCCCFRGVQSNQQTSKKKVVDPKLMDKQENDFLLLPVLRRIVDDTAFTFGGIVNSTDSSPSSLLTKRRLWKARMQLLHRNPTYQGSSETSPSSSSSSSSSMESDLTWIHQILISPTNDAWFGKEQLFQLLRVIQEYYEQRQQRATITNRSSSDEGTIEGIWNILVKQLLLLDDDDDDDDDDAPNYHQEEGESITIITHYATTQLLGNKKNHDEVLAAFAITQLIVPTLPLPPTPSSSSSMVVADMNRCLPALVNVLLIPSSVTTDGKSDPMQVDTDIPAKAAASSSSASSFITLTKKKKQKLIQSMMQGRQLRIFSNLARYTKSYPYESMLLLEHLLLRNKNETNNNTTEHNDDDDGTTLMKFMIAKVQGVSIQDELVKLASTNTKKKKTTFSDGNMEDSSSDEEEDEDDDDDVYHDNRAMDANKRQRRSHEQRKSRQQQLLTMPKLHKLYQQQQYDEVIKPLSLSQQKQEERQAERTNELIELANAWTDPSLWITWARVLLLQQQQQQGITADGSRKDSAQQQERQTRQVSSYVRLLSRLLQSISGIKPSATSPFLSQLVQERWILQSLWNLYLQESSSSSLSSNTHGVVSRQVATDEKEDVTFFSMQILICFSDLFSHHLIALRDSDFLEYYTLSSNSIMARNSKNNNNNNNTSNPIVAEQIIEHVKVVLYELYWSKPVMVQDFQNEGRTTTTTMSHHHQQLRARLLLSGTKLWNMLYERWCRLVRQAPFASEDQWWFSLSASHATDRNAVVGTRGENRIIQEDDEEDDDRMEIDDDGQGNHGVGGDDGLAHAFRDPKMARVLTCIPQALPFERRVKLFDALLKADKLRTQDDEAQVQRILQRMMEDGRDDELGMVGREKVEIHRNAMYSDSMKMLSQLGPRLKRKLQVTFINQHGQYEAGIDGGGIIKEFLDDLIKEAFSPTDSSSTTEQIPRLFAVTPLETLMVTTSLDSSRKEMLAHYEFLGRVLGKAVYESILVEPQFCLPFLNQLLGKQNSLEDLKNLDPEFYSNLMKLRVMSSDEIANLGLTFELTLDANRPSVPLLPNGSRIPVTKSTVIQYTHLVAHRRLNMEGAAATKAFLRGFRDLIPASWVRLFSAYELQKLISGDDTVKGIDVKALKQSMQYAAGYHPSQPIMQWFWEVLEEMSPTQQAKFLKFMTSCSRQPLLGFASLEPAPCIQQIRLPDELFMDNTDNDDGNDTLKKKNARLPTSSTCMNLLKLPNYRSKELLRTKLIAAIESGAGFELT